MTQHIWHQSSQLDSFFELEMLKIVFPLVTGGASNFWPPGHVEQGTTGIFINKQTLSI